MKSYKIKYWPLNWSQKPPEAVSRGCKLQTFPGGACPQTPLVWEYLHTPLLHSFD